MNLRDILEKVKQQAEEAGAIETSISITSQKNNRIDIRDKKIEKTKSGESLQLSLQVYIDGKYSRHSTNRLDEDSLKSFVKNAVEATHFMQKDNYRSLPDATLYPKEEKDFDNYDSSIDDVTADELLKNALNAYNSQESNQKDIISAQSSFSINKGEHYKLNSNGFFGKSSKTHFTQSVNVTLQAEDDKRAEETAYVSTSHLNKLPTAESLFSEAYHRAKSKVGEKKAPSGVYDLIVENRISSKFISILLSAMAASALDQRRTFLEGRKDTLIAAKHFSIIDDPYVNGGYGSFWFDDEGIAPQKRFLVQEGRFVNHLVDSYYGKKLELPINSALTGNLFFDGNIQPVNDIIKGIESGIRVSSFNGGNSNPATGDFSFGISGMLIQNGVMVKPVSEMVITGNVLTLFEKLNALGDDPYPYAAMRRPSLHFKSVDCSGL